MENTMVNINCQRRQPLLSELLPQKNWKRQCYLKQCWHYASYKCRSWQPFLSELHKNIKKLYCPSTIGVDNRSFQSYLQPGRRYAFHRIDSRSFHRYLKMITLCFPPTIRLVFKATLKELEIAMFPSIFGMDIRSLQSYLKPGGHYASR